jgi:hypothetical protein
VSEGKRKGRLVMAVYHVSHTNPDGVTGVAMARVTATSEREAQRAFERQYPRRRISVIGEPGVGA